MNKWLILVFYYIIIISIFIFIEYKGYVGMFSFKEKEQIEQIDTIKKGIINQETKPMITIDTVSIYRVIVGSFKIYNNAVRCSNLFDYSDILPITKNGLYRVSKDYYFDLDEALYDINNHKYDSWLLKDNLFIKI